MRIYYVFNIKREYSSLYKENQSNLYSILCQLYYLKKKDIDYGLNLYNQLINKINKFDLDKYIFLKYHTRMSYVKKGNNHILNNLYKDEISVLVVKNSYILINSNRNYTDFFKLLYNYNSNLFVCDFVNNDYFYISDIKTLV